MKRLGGAGYDFALRERIVTAVQEGKSVKETASQFAVTLMTVYTYMKRHRLGVLDVVGKPTGRPFRVTAEHEAQLLKQLETHSDATLVEHAGRRRERRPFCPRGPHA
ncbi:transposase [Deinococcus sp. UYEF24]